MTALAPYLSVVMPTYNRRNRVLQAIAAVAEQQVDVSFEIVVVSDGSTDGTDELLATLDVPAALSFLSQPNGGPASARNRGVERARGELVVFLDDDVIAAPGLLQAHVDAHRELGDEVVVVGPMLDPPDFKMAPWVRWEQAMLRKQYAAMDAGAYDATARQFYTGNASVRREYLIAAGGFDETFRRAEDVELAYRLGDMGLRFSYQPSAIGLHHAERSLESWRAAAHAYGRNDVIFARDRGQSWMYAFIAQKYRDHFLPLRTIIASCVRMPIVRAGAGVGFEMLGLAADRLGFERLVRVAYSAIFGIEYHVGVRDELGGTREFVSLVRSGE